MKKEQIKDYTLRISQANASGLVVIIYELLIAELEDAIQAEKQDKEQCIHHIQKARRLMGELIHGLDLQNAIARQLSKKYIELHKDLLFTQRHPDVTILTQVKEQMENMQSHFIRIAKEDKEEPIMANTQKIYAGLTYSKNQLNETAVDNYSNRGYQV